MRLLFIAALYPPYIVGGAEISTQLLCESLVKLGHKVSVITTIKGPSRTEIMNGVTVHFVKQRNIYWKYPARSKGSFRKLIFHTIDIYNFLYKKEVREIIHDFKPDIVHSQNLCGISTFVWDLAERASIPIVHTLRDYYLLCPKQSMTTNGVSCTTQCRVCHIYSVPKRILSEKVSAVVGISRFILNKHLDYGYFTKSRTQCIANSVRSFGFSNKNKNYRIGYIGRIAKEKGIDFLIDAFIEAENPKYTLVIAGEGELKYVNYLKTKYPNESVVFIGGVIADEFYKTIDLLVVPSVWDEPFGRVVIESYAHGIPVFVSEKGGLPELVKEYTGRVFSIDSTKELRSLLISFFEDQLLFDHQKILNEISNFYTERAIAREYEKLYKDLIIKNTDEDSVNS